MKLPVTLTIDRRSLAVRLLVRADIAAIALHADARCEILRGDGRCEAAAVDPVMTAVFPWLIMLHYRIGGRREALVLPMAALGDAGHRRLRVWLRWQGLSVSARHEPTR